MQTEAKDCNIITYDDDLIFEKIKNCEDGNFNYAEYIRQYKVRISEDRLYFLHNRGTIGAFLCNYNANQMEKNLNIFLQDKKNNKIKYIKE